MPFCCTVLAPNQRRKPERKDCAGSAHTRAIISPSHLTSVSAQLSLLNSISSPHWLPLFWTHNVLAHSRRPADFKIQGLLTHPVAAVISNSPRQPSRTVEHVALLSISLGDKFEGPKKWFKQKPANRDKDAKYELLFKENDL